MQHAAQGADGPVSRGSGLQKGVTLGGGEIEASAFSVVEWGGRVHDCNRLLAFCFTVQQNEAGKGLELQCGSTRARDGRTVF
jgi:hypothetical protein